MTEEKFWVIVAENKWWDGVDENQNRSDGSAAAQKRIELDTLDKDLGAVVRSVGIGNLTLLALSPTSIKAEAKDIAAQFPGESYTVDLGMYTGQLPHNHKWTWDEWDKGIAQAQRALEYRQKQKEQKACDALFMRWVRAHPLVEKGGFLGNSNNIAEAHPMWMSPGLTGKEGHAGIRLWISRSNNSGGTVAFITVNAAKGLMNQLHQALDQANAAQADLDKNGPPELRA